MVACECRNSSARQISAPTPRTKRRKSSWRTLAELSGALSSAREASGYREASRKSSRKGTGGVVHRVGLSSPHLEGGRKTSLSSEWSEHADRRGSHETPRFASFLTEQI